MKKILIIEDEAISALGIKAQFEIAGFFVCQIASTEDAAVREAKKENPDLLLCDVRLARNNSGIEAVRKIKLLDPSVMVAFMTGYDDPALLKDLQELDPVGVFIKPLSSTSIEKMIDLLADHSLSRNNSE